MDKANIMENAINQVSLFSLFSNADLVVQMVMILLFASSVWCWATIFNKYFLLHNITKVFIVLEKQFNASSSLEDFNKKVQEFAKHPCHRIFMSALGEFTKNKYDDLTKLSDYDRNSFKERLEMSMEIALEKSSRELSKNIPSLATIASSSPFIGLFGTVWGIMDSFQSIAIAKNTTLAVVAPGIAEALLATAMGLFVAIPALLFYNFLLTKLNFVKSKSADFATQLQILFSRKLDEK